MAQKGWLTGPRRWLSVAVVFGVLISACGSSEDSPTGSPQTQTQNHGGSMEGHTPRGFAGSGTGLFVGDNLNPGFPDGDGVQMWLSFDLPEGTPTPSRALLRSEALTVRGTPFADLGALQAEPVMYDSFSPQLFDRPSTGAAVTCNRVSDRGIECDVTDAVTQAIDRGEDRAQFRFKFETAGDNDGEADLAMFFLTDSNTNEPGIFTLDLS
jgi:hypothetical protein